MNGEVRAKIMHYHDSIRGHTQHLCAVRVFAIESIQTAKQQK